MSKVLLVEDDTNLSEIYQARLEAEGYEVVAAPDGETALAVAAKEKPDLVLSDVMMPKISGFEMLDILRNTEGLKNTKVIMLTALGQAEDKSRAEKLGADRYLVKSQVTLEDIVKAAQELLGQDDLPSAEELAQPAINSEAMPAADPASTLQPAAAEQPQAAPTGPLQPTEPANLPAAPAPQPAQAAQPVAPAPALQSPAANPAPAAPVVQQQAVQPAPAPTPVQTPVAQPVASVPVATQPVAPTPAPAQPAAQEAASVQDKIDSFEAAPAPAPAEVTPAPTASQPAPPSTPPPLDEGVVANAIDRLLSKTPQAPVTAAPTETAPAPAATDSQDDQTEDYDSPVERDRPRKKIISPIDRPTRPSLEELVAKEEARETVVPPAPQPPVGSLTATQNPQPPVPNSGLDPKTVAL